MVLTLTQDTLNNLKGCLKQINSDESSSFFRKRSFFSDLDIMQKLKEETSIGFYQN